MLHCNRTWDNLKYILKCDDRIQKIGNKENNMNASYIYIYFDENIYNVLFEKYFRNIHKDGLKYQTFIQHKYLELKCISNLKEFKYIII